MELIPGKYSSVRGKELTDFYVKSGMAPESLAEKMVNSHWDMRIFDCVDQRFMWYISCKELPEFNIFNSWTVGKETTSIEESLGGEVKIICNFTEDKVLHTIMKTPKYGTIEFFETYTPEGVKMVVKNDSGESCTCFWTREVDMFGTFWYDKGENIKEFSAQSMFEMRPTYRARIECSGDKYKITESLGGGEEWITHSVLGVESDVDLFGTKIKMLLTKEGDSLKFVGKTPNGEENCHMEFFPDGMKMTCKHIEKGVSCTVWHKRAADFTGSYKLIKHDMPDKAAELFGMPMEEFKKMVNDETARVTIEEDGTGYKFECSGKYTPTCGSSFKLGEEFEFTHPTIEKMHYKAVPFKKDNVMTMDAKFDDYEVKATMVFKNNFIAKTTSVPSKDLEWNELYVRDCSK